MKVDDPFEEPWQIPLSEVDARQTLNELVPENIPREGLAVIVATPEREPCHVKGAVVGGLCSACGTRVWAAPSTQRQSGRKAFVCSTCLARAYARRMAGKVSRA